MALRTHRWLGAAACLTAFLSACVVPNDESPISRTSSSGLRDSSSVISMSPLTIKAPSRGVDLTLRVSAPVTGTNLPIIVFAHGYRSSSDEYQPLVQHWAAHGFVVIQPTFLDSWSLGLTPDDGRWNHIWRTRVTDVTMVLDHLAAIEEAVPGLSGRMDPGRIAVAGHSYGGITAGMLLGARVIEAGGAKIDLSDPRIRAGVLLSTAGHGESDLSEFAARNFPFMNPSFQEMRTPALVISGAQDRSPLSKRGPDWFTDPYTRAPGEKCLVVLSGAEHMLGGVAGRGMSMTTDESPRRVAIVAELSLAYLSTALGVQPSAWPAEARRWSDESGWVTRLECKH